MTINNDITNKVISRTSLTRNSRCSQITSSWAVLELERLRDIEVGINVRRVIEVTDLRSTASITLTFSGMLKHFKGVF